MSQHDFNIDNQSAPAFRSDLNNALEALGTLSSGPTAPATTYANMLWYDTASNILKMRSEADDAWINIGTLNQSTNTFTPAGVAELSQAQAENDASTVFGQVSGQRLAQAVAANGQQVGVGQTWQDVSASRASDLTVYQNSTGKPIQVNILFSGDFNSAYFEVSDDNVTWVRVYSDFGDGAPVPMSGIVVPDSHYYRSSTSGGATDPTWLELR